MVLGLHSAQSPLFSVFCIPVLCGALLLQSLEMPAIAFSSMRRALLPGNRYAAHLRRVEATQSRTSYPTHTGQAIASASAVQTAVDVDEFVSGKPVSTFPGKLVQGIFPAPLRFTVCWIPPLLMIASCHAPTVARAVSSIASFIMAELPIIQPLAHFGTFPLVLSIYMGMLKCLPMLFTFAVLPLLDWMLGEEDAQELGTPSSPWTYDITFYGFAALHMASLVNTIYIASLPGTSALQLLLLCLNQGVTGGYAINIAHELTHHSNRAHKFLGEALLTSCCYQHWPHSHRAHHSQVATYNDPASARYQESVYRFMIRCISGEWQDAVRLEMQRVQKKFPNMSRLRQVLKSRIPGWIGWPIGVAYATQACFGTAGLAAFLGSSLASVIVLTSINYVEHYGLTRKVLPSGQYESVSIHHSWNANHLVTNAALLRLQRHTDHHMHGHIPFYQLRNVEGAPRLPADYSTMMLAALVPPLWFIIMNPRVQLYKLLADVGMADPEKRGAADAEPAGTPSSSA